MKLSIIIPIYNEEKTLKELVEKVLKVNLGNIDKEILLVNDCSKDKSAEIIKELVKKHKEIKSFEHKINKGKGAALRTGFAKFTGDFVIIQDADLEYNPQDYSKLIKPILEGKADVVYGSRMLGHIHGFSIKSHYYGNKFLTFLTALIYGRSITDMETCYKLMKKEIAKNLNLKSNKFDIEPEITAKILKRKLRIVEVPIDYNARSFAEGKKITWKDGFMAIYTLFKYKFVN